MIKTILLYTGYVLATAVVTGVSYLNLAPQFGSNPSSLEKKQYAELSNYKDGSFINNEKTPLMTGDVSTWDFFKNDSMRKPKNLTPRKINYSKFVDESNSDYRLAWLGHSAFIINISGIIILLDPMLGSHASPIPLPSLKRYNDELPIDLSSIPNIDFVILSHDHYDHLDYSTIKRIKEKVNTFLVPLGVGNHLKNWNVKKVEH